MKKPYEKPELKVVEFETEDVITTSGGDEIVTGNGDNLENFTDPDDLDVP